MSGTTWPQVLAWRAQRQSLDPRGAASVVDVVERLGAVPAWPEAAAEWAIGVRRASGARGDAARALADQRVVKIFACRGATHLALPHGAGAYLAVRASGRMWERASWQSYYDLTPADWPRFLVYVRGVLSDVPLSHSHLLAHLRRSSRYRHLAEILASGNDTLLKPLSWQGVLGLGPPAGGEATFVALDAMPGWGGVPDLDEAGRQVLEHHLRTYGPTTRERLGEWFGKGLGAGSRALERWLAALEPRLVDVAVEGEQMVLLADDLDSLRATAASAAVHLLPGRDPWVMAPGTADPHVVPPAHREPISRTAAPVIARGRVVGTWTERDGRLTVGWFDASGRVPRAALERAVEHRAGWLGRPLDLTVRS